MKIAINDTSVLIDLSIINLLDPFLKLPFEMMTTDFIIEEIKDPRISEKVQAYIKQKRLTVISSTLEEMNTIQEIACRLSSLSYADCSVYFHSRRLNAILLTGDNRIRKEAISSD